MALTKITSDGIVANAITIDKIAPSALSQLGGGGGGSGVILFSNTTISSNITIAAGQNGLSIGPVTITEGANVTIAPGQRWLIL